MPSTCPDLAVSTAASAAAVAARAQPRRLPASISFVLLAAVLFAFFFAASAPSPLFVVFQHAWHFSSSMLTVAYAVYAIALLSGFAGVPFVTYFSAYAHDDLHLGLNVTAHAWALVGLAGAVSGLALGMIGDARSAAGQPQRDGMRTALISAGILLLCASAITASRPGVLALMIAAVAFGFSFFPLFGLLHAYVGKTSAPAFAAIVCGVCEASFGVGGAAGNLIGGLCKSVSGSFQPVYVCAAIASLLVVGLTWFVPGVRRAPQANPCALANLR